LRAPEIICASAGCRGPEPSPSFRRPAASRRAPRAAPATWPAQQAARARPAATTIHSMRSPSLDRVTHAGYEACAGTLRPDRHPRITLQWRSPCLSRRSFGTLGSVVANELIAAKEKVKVLVRDPSKGAAWSHRGAEIAVGALDRRGVPGRRAQGAAGFFVLLPPNYAPRTFSSSSAGWPSHRRRGESKSGVAARGGASRRSARSAREDRADQGASPPGECAARHRHKVTAIRAGFFQEKPATRSRWPTRRASTRNFTPSADYAFPQIATKDIGAAAAQTLRNPPAKNAVIDLVGCLFAPADRREAERRWARSCRSSNVPPQDQLATLQQAGTRTVAEAFVECTRLRRRHHPAPGRSRRGGYDHLRRVLRGSSSKLTLCSPMHRPHAGRRCWPTGSPPPPGADRDVPKLLRQHAAYVMALRELASDRAARRAARPPDVYFVEDVALLFPELAVVTAGAPERLQRPRPSHRRSAGYRTSIASSLRHFGRRDVLVVGRRLSWASAPAPTQRRAQLAALSRLTATGWWTIAVSADCTSRAASQPGEACWC